MITAISLIISHITLSVGAPVKNLETSELNDSVITT
jgi:hypothetical protein